MTRDLAKTLSFAVLHFGVGFGVTFLLTGSVAIATGVALLEPLANTVVFFFHERVWRRVGERDLSLKSLAPGLGHQQVFRAVQRACP